MYNWRCGHTAIRKKLMLTNYRQMLLQDLTSPTIYGVPLAGWKEQLELHRAPAAGCPTQASRA